jgi:hypothetical protein
MDSYQPKKGSSKMEFVTSKEHADEMVKSLLNMKQAIEFIQTMIPNSEVKKDGRNILIVEYNGTEIYFYKRKAEVVINGRGGEAFRTRNLGFCPKHMKSVFDCNVREINARIEIVKAAKARNDIRQQRMIEKRAQTT